MLTPKELRKLTDEAIERAKQEREMKIKAELEAELRKDKEAEVKAESIIAQIPHRAETEARAGRNHAVVMSLSYGEYEIGNGSGGHGPARITSKEVGGRAALLVWKHCADAGFKPALESWDDGVGMRGGVNIVIHW